MFKNVNSALDSIISDGVPGNDILIYQDGKEVFRSYRGYSDRENKVLMNGKEKYNMYSCSKPITATATMQLVEKGEIKLDDPLYEYIPEFKDMYILQDGKRRKAKNYITIKHLLGMTAGLTYDTASPSIQEAQKYTNGKCPTLETVKYISQEPLVFEPGTKWNYSLCHDVLAAVIEAVSGVKFGEHVNNSIFKPLGMKHSTFLLPDDELKDVCAQYIMTKNGVELCGEGAPRLHDRKIQSYKLGDEFESGGAGLISTVEDYMKFTEAMRIGDVILSKEYIDLMQTNILHDIDSSWYWPAQTGYGYGLGVRCKKTENDPEITDFGWGGAAGSYLAIDPTNNFTVFYAMHVLCADLDGRKGLLHAVKADLNKISR